MSNEVATEATKTTLENSVSWFLAEKLAGTTMPIVTNKYITGDNVLIYLTRCEVADISAPRIKVQILKRVDGGIYEANYQLFSDHKLTRTDNNMIFGAASQSGPADQSPIEVSETEAQALITTVNGLTSARPAL
jgi:hypothetical protein